MRPQKVLDIEILTGLTKVFRSRGYEGASLKELSEATGLKKASLYHRFPNGKQEMADAVLQH
ncbi:MAG: helix-turn-helix domain-containing protein, partial [Maribacter dokdonensis]